MQKKSTYTGPTFDASIDLAEPGWNGPSWNGPSYVGPTRHYVGPTR